MKLNGVHTTNPTKKIKIPSDKIGISLSLDFNGNEVFDLNFEVLASVISELKIQDDSAQVSLYAYSSSSEQEYLCGTVNELKRPKSLQLVDVDFESLRGFRLIIYNDLKQIIASNEKLKYRASDEPEDEESLLNTDLEYIGERIWKLKLFDDSNPILIFNKSIPNIRNAIKDSTGVLGSILPQLTQECIVHLAFNMSFEPDDKSCWQYNWIKFLESFGIQFKDIPDLHEEPGKYYSLLTTIDGLLGHYCFQKKFASKFAKDIGEILND